MASTKSIASSGSKLPIVLPRKSTSSALAGRAPRGDFAQAVQIAHLERNHVAQRTSVPARTGPARLADTSIG